MRPTKAFSLDAIDVFDVDRVVHVLYERAEMGPTVRQSGKRQLVPLRKRIQSFIARTFDEAGLVWGRVGLGFGFAHTVDLPELRKRFTRTTLAMGTRGDQLAMYNCT